MKHLVLTILIALCVFWSLLSIITAYNFEKVQPCEYFKEVATQSVPARCLNYYTSNTRPVLNP